MCYTEEEIRQKFMQAKKEYERAKDAGIARLDIKLLRRMATPLEKIIDDRCSNRSLTVEQVGIAMLAEMERLDPKRLLFLELINKEIDEFETQVETEMNVQRPLWWSWADDRARQAFESGLIKVIGFWSDGRDAENRFRVKNGYKGWILYALKCAFQGGHTDREALSYFVDEKGKPFSDITNPSNYTGKSDHERERKIQSLFERVESHST